MNRTQVLKILDGLEKQVNRCRACALWKTRTNTVFGKGNPMARLVVLGEGPGFDEDRTGLPFEGRAGVLMHRFLECAGFTPQDVYVMNTVKCRACEEVEGSRGTYLKNRPPETSELEACQPFFDQQLAALPNVACILALGGTAACHALGIEPGKLAVGRMRRKVIAGPYGPVIASYHPSYLLREDNAEQKGVVWEDWKRVKRLLAGEIPEDLWSDPNKMLDPDWKGQDISPWPQQKNPHNFGYLKPFQKDVHTSNLEAL